MIQYYEKWFRAKREPIKPLSEKEAEKSHNTGLPYIALLTLDNSKFMVDIIKGWVEFLLWIIKTESTSDTLLKIKTRIKYS